MNVRIIGSLFLRDAVVARREIPALLIRTMLQPVMFVIVFGVLLPRMGVMSSRYTTLLIPGVAALCLTTAAIWSVTIPLITDFGITREIEDRLLAPAPIELIAVQKVLAGMLQGALAVVFVLPVCRLLMGPVPGLTLRNFPLLVLMVCLGGAVFSAFGLWLATAMQPQQVSLMMQVVFAPMIMFGCTYYPWRGLDRFPFMKYAVLINPLVYLSEGMRAALTPNVQHMHVAVVIGALLVLITLLMWTGLRGFRKKAVT